MATMKAGMVTTVRISPKDCISILDILDVAQVRRDNMSFASCTSLALSSLIGMARQAGIIEEPDGFAFLDKVGPYRDGKNNKVKRLTSNSLYLAAQHGSAAISLPRVNTSMPPQVMEEQALRELKDRFTKLNDRKEADIPLSMEEEKEWQACFSVLYPDG